MAGGDADRPIWEALAQLSMLSAAPAKASRNCQICQADQINPRLNIKFIVTTIQIIFCQLLIGILNSQDVMKLFDLGKLTA